MKHTKTILGGVAAVTLGLIAFTHPSLLGLSPHAQEIADELESAMLAQGAPSSIITPYNELHVSATATIMLDDVTPFDGLVSVTIEQELSAGPDGGGHTLWGPEPVYVTAGSFSHTAALHMTKRGHTVWYLSLDTSTTASPPDEVIWPDKSQGRRAVLRIPIPDVTGVASITHAESNPIAVLEPPSIGSIKPSPGSAGNEKIIVATGASLDSRLFMSRSTTIDVPSPGGAVLYSWTKKNYYTASPEPSQLKGVNMTTVSRGLSYQAQSVEIVDAVLTFSESQYPDAESFAMFPAVSYQAPIATPGSTSLQDLWRAQARVYQQWAGAPTWMESKSGGWKTHGLINEIVFNGVQPGDYIIEAWSRAGFQETTPTFTLDVTVTSSGPNVFSAP